MAQLTVAASERAFEDSFNILRDSIAWKAADAGDFGAFNAGYDVQGHLEGGSLDLRGDNTVAIKELDIRWDKLEFTLGLDIPEVCVGGGCVDLPWPFPDVCLPQICVFEDDPDVQITVDLAAVAAQEVSIVGGLDVRFFDASSPPPAGFDPCGALRDLLIVESVIEPFPDTNQWQLFINPQTVDIDVFDFPDIVGNLVEDALTDAVTALIPGGWVRDLVLAIVGGIADLIRFLLDIPDDIEEWVSDLFNVSLGLLDVLISLVGDFFGNCVPIYRIDDPLELLPASDSTGVLLSGTTVTLAPVKLPIENLTVRVDDAEMVIEADVGA
jgi:hypothetical protein